MQTLKTKSLVWHHFEKPTDAELRRLATEFRLHPILLEELTRPTMRPKANTYDGALYLVLHFPLFDALYRKSRPVEIDFVLTPRALLSVAYEPIAPLEEFMKACATDAECEDLYASKTPAHLFAAAVKSLYGFALRQLDHIEERLNRIEEAVFSSDHEAERIIEELAIVRHDLIDFRRAIKPHQSTLESLMHEGPTRYGESVRGVFAGLIGEYFKVWNAVENHRETIDALYDNNVTVLQIKQNEAMRIVAIMAFITFPLMLFTALFSMNTAATPLIGNPYDFWIILGIMAAASIGMFFFFKRKRWL